MIRWVDSCSWCTTSIPFGLGNGPAAKYTSVSSFSGARQAGPVGPEGQGMYNFFDCSITMSRTLDTQAHWRDSRTLYINVYNVAEQPQWQWRNAAGVVGYWTLGSDGKIRIRNGTGALLYTSQTTLAPHQFYHVDLDWYFPPSGLGTCALYINNVLDTAVPGFPSVNGAGWGGQSDRFTIVGINNVANGYSWCDLVVSDGSGSVNNARLGPCRVKMYTPSTDQFIQWAGPTPSTLPSSAAAVNETPLTVGAFGSAPDGDTTYVGPPPANGEDLFGVAAVDCYASVLGVAMSVCLRDPQNGSTSLIVRPTPSNGQDTVIANVANPFSYGIVQGITEVDQVSLSGPWLDGDIQNAWWGIKVTAGKPIVTQIVLEKVTTRSGAPYTCGYQGSYCF